MYIYVYIYPPPTGNSLIDRVSKRFSSQKHIFRHCICKIFSRGTNFSRRTCLDRFWNPIFSYFSNNRDWTWNLGRIFLKNKNLAAQQMRDFHFWRISIIFEQRWYIVVYLDLILLFLMYFDRFFDLFRCLLFVIWCILVFWLF